MQKQSNLLVDLYDEFQTLGVIRTEVWQQVVIVLLCAGFSYLIARSLRPRIGLRQASWRFGSEGLSRVLTPLLFYIGIQLATVFMGAHKSQNILHLASSLAEALVAIRCVIYCVRYVFAQSHWVGKFERFAAYLIWGVVASHITGLLPTILDGLDEVDLHVGKQRISVLMILNGATSIAIAVLAALWLGKLIERQVMKADGVDLSARVVVTKVIRTILVVLAAVVALPIVGIDPTVLSVFGGALGVGLGFGLQKVASNYVSGFIILIDRAVRIGDVVTIDNRQGQISNITARYTVLKSSDGTEVIIPNEALITGTVVNQSYHDRNLRITLNVTVAGDTDVEHAMAIIQEACVGEARVLIDPPPQVNFAKFAENGIELELCFWIGDPENGTAGIKSAINLKIWKAFGEQGIEIPSPKRDVRILGGERGN